MSTEVQTELNLEAEAPEDTFKVIPDAIIAEILAQPSATEEPAPVKRPRGRPKGSKNKPKDPNAPVKPKKAKAKAEESPAPSNATIVKPVAKVFVPEDDIVESDAAELNEAE